MKFGLVSFFIHPGPPQLMFGMTGPEKKQKKHTDQTPETPQFWCSPGCRGFFFPLEFRLVDICQFCQLHQVEDWKNYMESLSDFPLIVPCLGGVI